jgi:GT2 family glycosyltransferase
MPVLRDLQYSKVCDKSISIVIPTRDKINLLKSAISSIEKIGLVFELIVLDNQSSSDESFAYFNNLEGSGVQVYKCDYPFNFSKLCNEGAKLANHDYLLFMNNDCELMSPAHLVAIFDVLDDNLTGTVGPRYVSTINPPSLGLQLGVGGIAGAAISPTNTSNQIHKVDLNSFAFVAMRKDVYWNVGGMDETLPVGLNDVDFGIRVLKAGYNNLALPCVEVAHNEYGTRAKLNTFLGLIRALQDVLVFLKKWPDFRHLAKSLTLAARR